MIAWCFDEAVGAFGRWVEFRLDEKKPVKKHGQTVGYKPKWRLEQLLGTEQYLVPTEAEINAVLG